MPAITYEREKEKELEKTATSLSNYPAAAAAAAAEESWIADTKVSRCACSDSACTCLSVVLMLVNTAMNVCMWCAGADAAAQEKGKRFS